MPKQLQKIADEQNRPIVALFLGEGNSPWSQRLQQELIPCTFFREQVASEGLIWQIRDSQQVEQHYGVQQFPCILLLDPKGKEFARLDYDASDSILFSKRILSLIQDFHEVCKAIDRGLPELDEETLRTLYVRASHLSTTCFKQLILHQGLRREKGTFFHLEKYALLLDKVKLKHPEVLKLKKELLARDADNRWGTQRIIALLEFEKRAATLKQKERVEKALAPLISYLERFGDKDENGWRVEMQIAEFLFARHALTAALDYAKKAQIHAPQNAKSQIASAMAYMQER